MPPQTKGRQTPETLRAVKMRLGMISNDLEVVLGMMEECRIEEIETTHHRAITEGLPLLESWVNACKEAWRAALPSSSGESEPAPRKRAKKKGG